MKDHRSLLRCVISIFAVALFLCCDAFAQQDIEIRGSETLIYLGQRVSSLYQKDPNASPLRVLGGGIPKTLSPNEIAQWEGTSANPQSRGSEHIVFPVGIQTVVIYVHRSNAVRALTLSQVRKIFLGEITNWKELGGQDSTILLYAGESSTGTLAYFQDALLHGDEPYPFVGKSNTKDLLNEIAQRPDSIGYGSLDSNPEVATVSIKVGPTSLPVEPTRDNIRSRQYPITRYIYWAVSNKAGSSAVTLCHWVLSPTGQLVVESVGFEPLLPSDRSAGLQSLNAATPARVLPAALGR